MRKEAKIKFVKTREEDGDSLYDLIIDGEVVERDLDIKQVVERINARDEDIPPLPSRRPEDRRQQRRRRCL
jgi:intein/homing endonuclease